MPLDIDRLARAAVAADSGPEGTERFEAHWRAFGPDYYQTAEAILDSIAEQGFVILPRVWKLDMPERMAMAGEVSLTF